jgi:putative phage-type endonuclease
MKFPELLVSLIDLVEQWLPEPETAQELEQWGRSADELAETYAFTEKELVYVDQILAMFHSQYEEQIHEEEQIHKEEQKQTDEHPDLDELLTRKQTEQRTPEWYAQSSTIISASELSNLFASPYQRGKFVLSKTVPPMIRNQSLATFSDRMSAFDWGIRFEPVVKLIYEHKHHATIKELGRLAHPEQPRCTASPDGLIYTAADPLKRGRLIEIKCPVSRIMDGSIPAEYYAQMQMQLHVTGLRACEYVEASFSSAYHGTPLKEGPGLYHGFVALLRREQRTADQQEFYYIYSPVNAQADWTPMIETDEIIEMIPWRLLEWSEQTVQRNAVWWEDTQRLIDAFWDDVEKAKRGEFVAPESTRKAKKPKTDACLIHITKMDAE